MTRSPTIIRNARGAWLALGLLLGLGPEKAFATYIPWVVNGSAAYSGQVATLTNNAANQAGTAWNPCTISMASSWDMTFSVYFGSQDETCGADGLAFILQNCGTSQLGSDSGEHAYTGMCTNSVAVDFDTFQNTGYGDPVYNSLNIRNAGQPASTNISTCGTGLVSGPCRPPISLTQPLVTDAAYHAVEIRWDAVNLQLSVTVDSASSPSAVWTFPANYLTALLGGNGNVYYGWGASSGGSTNWQQVSQTSANLNACQAAPTPGTAPTPLALAHNVCGNTPAPTFTPPGPTPTWTASPTPYPAGCGTPVLANAASPATLNLKGCYNAANASANFTNPGGANMALLVHIEVGTNGAALPSAVSYGGSALTLVVQTLGYAGYIATYALKPPVPVGSFPIVVDFATSGCSWNVAAELWSGVDPASPIRASNGSTGSAQNFTTTLTTTGPASVVSDFLQLANASSVTVGLGAGQTSLVFSPSDGCCEEVYGDDKVVGPAGAQTLTYALSQSKNYTAQEVEITGPLCSSPTPTVTPSPSLTGTPTLTPSATPTGSSSATPTDSPSATPSASPTASPSGTPTATPSATPTASPSATPTATPTATATDSPSVTPTDSPSPTASATPTRTPSWTPTPFDTPTSTATVTPTSTPSATATDSPSVTPTDTSSSTSTGTASMTPTVTPSDSATATLTATQSQTGSDTPTPSDSPTVTPSATQSQTLSDTPTLSNSPTQTPSSTQSETFSATPTPSLTASSTPSPSPSPSATPSPSVTPTLTPSPSITVSPTVTPTPQPRPYQISVDVYNSAGERVCTVYAGASANPAGAAQLSVGGPGAGGGPITAVLAGLGVPGQPDLFWYGQNDGGQAVQNGVYYLKISSQDPFGTVTSRSLAVTVLTGGQVYMLVVYNSAGEVVRSFNLGGLASQPVDVAVQGTGGGGTLVSGVDASSGAPLGGVQLRVTLANGSVTLVAFDGLNDLGQPLASGSYMLELQSRSAGQASTVKVLVLTVLKGGGGGGLTSALVAPNPVPAQGPVQVHYLPRPGVRVRGRLYDLAGEWVDSAADAGGSGWLIFRRSMAGGAYMVVLTADRGGAVLERRVLKAAILR